MIYWLTDFFRRCGSITAATAGASSASKAAFWLTLSSCLMPLSDWLFLLNKYRFLIGSSFLTNTAFWLVLSQVRKHHCRNCGGVFCADCTDNVANVPSFKKPQRVCEICFNELKNAWGGRGRGGGERERRGGWRRRSILQETAKRREREYALTNLKMP